MTAFPPSKGPADKHFFGLFDGASLIAVIDLIDRYPDDRTAFLGLLMVANSRQRSGLGTFVVNALSDALRTDGYTRIRLGYLERNLSAEKFWHSQGFQPTGTKTVRARDTVIAAEKTLYP